jgi:hypothetical protein
MNNRESEEAVKISFMHVIPFATGKKEIYSTVVTHSTPFSTYPHDVSYHKTSCNILLHIYNDWTHKHW